MGDTIPAKVEMTIREACAVLNRHGHLGGNWHVEGLRSTPDREIREVCRADYPDDRIGRADAIGLAEQFLRLDAERRPKPGDPSELRAAKRVVRFFRNLRCQAEYWAEHVAPPAAVTEDHDVARYNAVRTEAGIAFDPDKALVSEIARIIREEAADA